MGSNKDESRLNRLGDEKIRLEFIQIKYKINTFKVSNITLVRDRLRIELGSEYGF